MKTDVKGCSTCPVGQEQWEEYHYSYPKEAKGIQYDYRYTDGELFTTIAKDLETARKRKSDWLVAKLVKGYKADPNCRPFDWVPADITPYEHTEFIRLTTGKIVVLGMDVAELSIKDICEELTDLRHDLIAIDDFERGDILHSEFTARTMAKVSDKGNIMEAIRVLEMQKKIRCEVNPKALSNLSKLPKECYSVLLSDPDQLIRIVAGESGYYPMAIPPEDFAKKGEQTVSQFADELNTVNGVTKAQRGAMMHGSMFGWDKGLADPDSYDSEGKPIINKL
jgi:hypothetical protein